MNGTVLLDRGFTGWSARFAVRVTAAVDLSGDDRHSVDQWYGWAHRGDVEYLRRLSIVDSAAFEVRWLVEPERPLSLVLLGRVDRRDRARAEADGGIALDRLTDVPAHVRALPLNDPAMIEHAFNPFRPQGIAEVRKPCLTSRPPMSDAPAIPLLRAVPAGWPGVLEFLATAGRPAMLSVGLVPTRPAPGFARDLTSIADRYRAIGRARVDADPFAETAERLYRAASARYRDTVFRLRITVATAGPLDELLAHGVAERIGRGIAEDVPGRSCVVERPATPRDLGALAASVRTLGVPRWGGHQIWRTDGVPQALRDLCEFADPTEAAAAAWLPAAVTGKLPGSFPTAAPDGELVRSGGDPGTQDKRVSPPTVP